MFENRSNIKLSRQDMKGEIVFQSTSNNSLLHVTGYVVSKAVHEKYLGSLCVQWIYVHSLQRGKQYLACVFLPTLRPSDINSWTFHKVTPLSWQLSHELKCFMTPFICLLNTVGIYNPCTTICRQKQNNALSFFPSGSLFLPNWTDKKTKLCQSTQLKRKENFRTW